jgi:hypothetical protein
MRTAVLAGLLVLAGCGYRLGGVSRELPEGAHTISIQLFRNHTREQGLDLQLRHAIEEEFRRRGPLQVVPPGEGDLELSGDIRRLTNTPVAFSGTDEAVQYQGTIIVGLRLVQREGAHVLYEVPALTATQDFAADRGVVISSSPRFQRGTMNARDLADLTNVQLIQARRAVAVRELLDQVARDVYRQAMEGF